MTAKEYVRRALCEATRGAGVCVHERAFKPEKDEHPDAAIYWQATGEEREGRIAVELEILAKAQDGANAIAGDVHEEVEGVAVVDSSTEILGREFGAHRMLLLVPAIVDEST